MKMISGFFVCVFNAEINVFKSRFFQKMKDILFCYQSTPKDRRRGEPDQGSQTSNPPKSSTSENSSDVNALGTSEANTATPVAKKISTPARDTSKSIIAEKEKQLCGLLAVENSILANDDTRSCRTCKSKSATYNLAVYDIVPKQGYCYNTE